MRARRAWKLIIAAGVLSMSGAWTPQETIQPEKTVRLHPRAGTPYLDLLFPETVTEADLSRYSVMLRLSEAQSALFRRLWAEYLERDTALRERDSQSLWERAARLGAQNIYTDIATATESADLFREASTLATKMVDNENQMLDLLRPVLTESQLVNLERMRNHRKRVHASTFAYEYPGAGIDLTDLVEQIGRAEEVVPLDRKLYEHALLDYETRVSGFFEQYAESRRKADSRLPALIANMQSLISTESGIDSPQRVEIQKKTYAEVMRLQEHGDQIAKRIHDINAQFVVIIAQSLPEQKSKEFRDAFHLLAYPPVYPNPFELGYVFDAALDSRSLGVDAKNGLNSLAIDYRSQRDSLSALMVRRFLKYREDWLKHRSRNMDEFNEYKSDMLALQTRRKEHADATMKNLQQILATSDDEAIRKAIALYNRVSSNHKSKENGIDFRP